VIEAKIQALQADFELEKAEIERGIHKEELEEKIHRETEIKMGEMRRVEGNSDL
jgi:predicted Holliday junction resolvase-like endonuclease